MVSFADILSKPPRPQPKVHQLQIRSHKLSILLTVLPSTTLEAIKADALSALTSEVNQVESIPKVKSADDFEVCRAIKDKGKATGAYEVMDVSKQVREYNLASWDTLYLQFRNAATGKHFSPCFCPSFHSHVYDSHSTAFSNIRIVTLSNIGKLLPVVFTQPSIDDEDEESPEEEYPISSKSKGKRKAPPDEHE